MDKLGLNFGLVIAYLIPGFCGTYALTPHVTAINALVGGAANTGSVVVLLLIALAVGIIINAISWVVVRNFIHFTGVKSPSGIVYRKSSRQDALRYNRLIESTFRYHQFYSNMLVGILLLTPLWLAAPVQDNILRNASFPFVVIILFWAARDSLRNYYNGLRSFAEEQDSKS